ncbi:Pr6Pr family membrane protein, partial [Bradyrhizobium sp. NBAIM08]|uniref:Pr6Pr family membrane protein n=1 Tax=Bradyrhizobium sp. NBAIM08 TaxID=2793815 RepID=UPI001CD4E3E6
GAALAADTLTHDVVPVFYGFYWLLFVPKGELSWGSPISWTIYPLLYLPYVLIRGSSTGRYPYPFLDVNALGLTTVLVNSMILTVVFLVLGIMFVVLDKIIARFGPGDRGT